MCCIRITVIRSSLGFLFDKKFGYSTDVVGMSDDVFDKLAGIDLWIVEALRATPHQSHSHYEQTFGWIDKVKPKRAVLTHLGLDADYETLMAICPDGTEPGIDGLTFHPLAKNDHNIHYATFLFQRN